MGELGPEDEDFGGGVEGFQAGLGLQEVNGKKLSFEVFELAAADLGCELLPQLLVKFAPKGQNGG